MKNNRYRERVQFYRKYRARDGFYLPQLACASGRFIGRAAGKSYHSAYAGDQRRVVSFCGTL